jgi:hypothetical protein
MFNLEFGGNGDTHPITPELIKQSIEALDLNQQDFINQCLQSDPAKRPSSKQLLFHPLLFEVPTLRLLSAHQLVKQHNESKEPQERIFNDSAFVRPNDHVIAVLNTNQSNYSEQDQQQNDQDSKEFKFGRLAAFDANKYLEDVKNGIYPLTTYGLDYQLKRLDDEPKLDHSSSTHSNQGSGSGAPNNTGYPLDLTNMAILSGNTSLAKSISSKSSSSSNSPHQSLSQNVLMQQHYYQQQHQQQNGQHDSFIDSESNLNSEIISSLPSKTNPNINSVTTNANNTNTSSSQSSTPVPQFVQNQFMVPISSSPQNNSSSIYNQQFQNNTNNIINNNNIMNTSMTSNSRTQSPILSNNSNNSNLNAILNSNGGANLLNNNINNQYGDLISNDNYVQQQQFQQQQQQAQNNVNVLNSKLETRHAQNIDTNVLVDEKQKSYQVNF